MRINQYVDLNLSASIMPPVLHMAQGDGNSRNIVATLWNGTSGFTVPSDAAVMVRFGKPDGTGGLYDHTEAGDAIAYSGNVVTAPVATQMLTAAGKVQANVEIYQAGATGEAAVRLATFTFFVNVEKSAYPDAEIISSDYFNILSAEIAAAVGAGAKADQAIQAAEDAEEAATAAGQSAAAAANSATAAGNSANAANTAKTGAEAAKTAAESAETAAQQAQGSAEKAATNAANSANAASTAKTGAETAKADAEAAQKAAETAQEAAEAARDEAKTIAGGAYVSYEAQTLTDEQKNQARENIGAASEEETNAALAGKQAALTAGQGISISGNTIDTKVYPCNPNLLDNWYFGNPVNQRGQTSYTGSGYTIDRFAISATDSCTISVVDGGLQLSASNRTWSPVLHQRIDNYQHLIGKTITVSMLVTEVTSTNGAYIRFDVGNTPNVVSPEIKTAGLISATGTISADDDTKGYALVTIGSNSASINFSATILAVKLELGTQQTLAHQDADGNWVLNEIPDYGEQLARCQRYYFKSDNVYGYGYINAGATVAYINVNLPREMRIAPTVVANGVGKIATPTSVVTPTSIAIASSTARFGTSVILSVGGSYGTGNRTATLTDAKLEFSADL